MRFFKWLRAAMRRLPIEVGIPALVLLLLLISYVTVWFFRTWRSSDVILDHSITPWRVLLEVAIIFSVAFVLFLTLRSKPRAASGDYPEIDEAWSAGIDALRGAGIAITSRPVFLIGGFESNAFANAAMTEVLPDAVIGWIPKEPSSRRPLRWYISQQAIYLFLSEIRFDDLAQPSVHSEAEQSRRLAYVCSLLRDARQTWCGANGMIFFVPYETLTSNASSITDGLRKKVSNATRDITNALELQIPMNIAICGMEDLGFCNYVEQLKFVERKDKEVLAADFGLEFDLSLVPLKSSMSAQRSDTAANHTNALFWHIQKKFYEVFGPAVLNRPQDNRRIYEFLVQTRSQIRPKLGDFLRNTFGAEERFLRRRPPAFFGGCYYVTIAAESAFLKGLLVDKLMSQQADVQWLRRVRITDFLVKFVTMVGWAAVPVALLILIQVLLE